MFASIEEKRQHYVDAKVYQCKRCGECMTSEQEWLKNVLEIQYIILQYSILFQSGAGYFVILVIENYTK